MTPSGAATVAGVAGWPVRHSLSPLIHAAWLADAGVDGAYVPFAVPPGRFAAFVEGLRGGAVRGLNVTLPHKEAAFALADRRSGAAEAAGAANLLLFEPDGSVAADNTDGAGLVGALEAADALRGPALVLGAGGAARGAVAALLLRGMEVRVANRTRARAEALADGLPALRAFGWEALDAAADGAALVVNATRAGLEGDGAIPLPWDRLAPGAAAMDMVYAPLRTPFLRAAEARGLATVDGLAMLLGQARPSFAAFYGVQPPAEVDVRALCLRALGEAPA